MSKFTLPTYTETLGESLDAVREYLKSKNTTLKDESAFYDYFSVGGIPYETNKTHSAELETGKPRAKRFLTVSLYRMPSGKYELTAYAM